MPGAKAQNKESTTAIGMDLAENTSDPKTARFQPRLLPNNLMKK
jgi:hypothetical protein